MMRAELIFIPSPGIGHLLSTIEFAKLLISRDERILASILMMELPSESGMSAYTYNLKKDAPQRLAFVEVPALDEITMAKLKPLPPTTFLQSFIENQRTHVRDVVTAILNRSESSRLCGFVVDMFCTSMIDVANEFNIPTYAFFTSGAAFLGLCFYVQSLEDDQDRKSYEFDSDVELSVPSFVKVVSAKVLPSVMLTKDGLAFVTSMAQGLRETKAILVNTTWELEVHAIKSLADGKTPLIYPVGPIINFNRGETTTDNTEPEEDIITWLDCQPPLSVVYLCFGSLGSFEIEQAREIANALELSGQRFLWSLRHPCKENQQLELLKGFLERTSGIGKVIGWAPQVTVLSHPSVGGFVSHCGWNSTLESIWCGVPIAAWPMYAEQQINAFELVVELGLAVEIKMDYRKDSFANIESTEIVTAEEIERGIRCLMDGDSDMRKKVSQMKDICRKATAEGGSSYTFIGQFIEDVITNIHRGASF